MKRRIRAVGAVRQSAQDAVFARKMGVVRKTIALWLIVAVILGVVVWDITHGGIGYVRYSAWGTHSGIIDKIIRMRM